MCVFVYLYECTCVYRHVPVCVPFICVADVRACVPQVRVCAPTGVFQRVYLCVHRSLAVVVSDSLSSLAASPSETDSEETFHEPVDRK